MWIDRHLENSIRYGIEKFPVVVITGARQVGKTHLIRHILPDARCDDLTNVPTARSLEGNPEAFFRERPAGDNPHILDEIQYVPGAFRAIKDIVDRRGVNGQFILSGSQSLPLMDGVTESLAGRAHILTLHSLSYHELRSAGIAGRNVSLDHHFFSGGYPKIYADDVDPNVYYPSYVTTYLERDVRNIHQIVNLETFDAFLRLCAARTGQILSYADLGRDARISPNTAKDWIGVLKATGIIQLVEPFFRNITKRIVKSPKLYFLDTGLAAHLMGFRSQEELARSSYAGAVWETFVVGQIVRDPLLTGCPIYFWRQHTGPEVDIVIPVGDRIMAVECKLTERPDPGDFRGLKAFRKYCGVRANPSTFIVCRTPEIYETPDAVILNPEKLPQIRSMAMAKRESDKPGRRRPHEDGMD